MQSGSSGDTTPDPGNRSSNDSSPNINPIQKTDSNGDCENLYKNNREINVNGNNSYQNDLSKPYTLNDTTGNFCLQFLFGGCSGMDDIMIINKYNDHKGFCHFLIWNPPSWTSTNYNSGQVLMAMMANSI